MMFSDAEDILEEVDSIMGEMRTNPVADIEKEFLVNNLVRLDSLMNEVRQYYGWFDRTRGIIPYTSRCITSSPRWKITMRSTTRRCYRSTGLSRTRNKIFLRRSLKNPILKLTILQRARLAIRQPMTSR